MPTLVAEPLSKVVPEAVRWLWEPYIPRGKLVLLDGDPGVGKSLLTVDLAARLSRGGPLPDGKLVGHPHVTLLIGAEDNAADTIRPRAEAAGADLDRLAVVSAEVGRLRFPDDLADLEELIHDRGADLVVIDPASAFLPSAASFADACVRATLGAMGRCAERHHCTILLVRHLRKALAAKAIHRGLGSVGIIGAVRAGLLVAPHPTDAGLRVMAVTKTNLATTPPALGFRLRTTDPMRVGVEWAGPLGLTADALGLPPVVPLRPRDRAIDWLAGRLARGPRRSADILAEAGAEGIPDRTLDRAKQELRVKSHLVRSPDGTREWYWYDPCAPWPSDAPFDKPGLAELPPLEELF